MSRGAAVAPVPVMSRGVPGWCENPWTRGYLYGRPAGRPYRSPATIGCAADAADAPVPVTLPDIHPSVESRITMYNDIRYK